MATDEPGEQGRCAPARRSSTAAQWCAGAVALVCVAVSGVHLVWALSPWPAQTWWDWNRTVMGTDDPAARTGAVWAGACLLVAGLLVSAAWIVGVRGGLFRRTGPGWFYRISCWGVVVVFLGRGVLGLLKDVPDDLPAHDWNLYLYSPLCLVLASLSAVAAVAAGPRPPDR
jgi:hypothetical protein